MSLIPPGLQNERLENENGAMVCSASIYIYIFYINQESANCLSLLTATSMGSCSYEAVCQHLCEGYKTGCPFVPGGQSTVLALCLSTSKWQHKA